MIPCIEHSQNDEIIQMQNGLVDDKKWGPVGGEVCGCKGIK